MISAACFSNFLSPCPSPSLAPHCLKSLFSSTDPTYSKVAFALTQLVSTKSPFCWSQDDDRAFTMLKSCFTSAQILMHPDPSLQFVVEVDASDTGVGAILSQRNPGMQKLHPCAFFPLRLSPAGRNYDVGNREFLSVVLALQEWKHWLEGSEIPFLIWTDHKNLSYLHSARGRNPRPGSTLHPRVQRSRKGFSPLHVLWEP